METNDEEEVAEVQRENKGFHLEHFIQRVQSYLDISMFLKSSQSFPNNKTDTTENGKSCFADPSCVRKDLLDSVCVQGGVQVVKTLHPLSGFQVVRNHVLGKDPLHQQPVHTEGNIKSRISSDTNTVCFSYLRV